jgi:hypothetical protein
MRMIVMCHHEQQRNQQKQQAGAQANQSGAEKQLFLGFEI